MKRLYRCRWNKKISGVFGGLGIYLRVDPTILRIIALILIIPTGIILLPLLYFLAAKLIPEGPKHYIQPNCSLLYKSSKDRMIAGVCGCIAEFFQINSLLVRAIFIILMIFSFGVPIILVYIICAIVIPQKPNQWR